MKKVFIILTVLILSAIFVSCSGGQKNLNQTEEQPHLTENPTKSIETTNDLPEPQVSEADNGATQTESVKPEPTELTESSSKNQTPIPVVSGGIDLGEAEIDGDYYVYNAVIKDDSDNSVGSILFSYIKEVGYSSEAMFGNLGLNFGSDDGYKIKVRIKQDDGVCLYNSDSDLGKQYIVKEDESSSVDGYICDHDKLYGISVEEPELLRQGKNKANLVIEVYNSDGEKLSQDIVLDLNINFE